MYIKTIYSISLYGDFFTIIINRRLEVQPLGPLEFLHSNLHYIHPWYRLRQNIVNAAFAVFQRNGGNSEGWNGKGNVDVTWRCSNAVYKTRSIVLIIIHFSLLSTHWNYCYLRCLQHKMCAINRVSSLLSAGVLSTQCCHCSLQSYQPTVVSVFYNINGVLSTVYITAVYGTDGALSAQYRLY